MRGWAVIVAVVSSLLAADVVAGEVTVATEIQARYDQVGAAIAANNWSAVRSVYAPEYRSTDVDGKVVTVDEEINGLQRSPRFPDKATKTTVLSVRVEGATAYVSQRVDASFTLADKEGSMRKVVVVATSADEWRLASGVWLLVSTETRVLDMTVDGVKVLHKERTNS